MRRCDLITRVLIVAAIAVAQAAAAAPEQKISKQDALRATEQFRDSDPMSERARFAAAVVMRFVDVSPDAIVRITPRALPTMSSKELTEAEKTVLLAAFVVGNVRAQLVRGKAEDDPYAGDRQLIETYRRLRKAKPGPEVPEIEKLIQLDGKGELHRYLAVEK